TRPFSHSFPSHDPPPSQLSTLSLHDALPISERHVGLSGPDAGATSSSGEGPAPPDPVATAPSAGCVPSSADTAVEALSPGCATRSTPAASAEPTPSARTGEPAERRDSVSVSASGSAGPFGGTGLGISYSPDL